MGGGDAGEEQRLVLLVQTMDDWYGEAVSAERSRVLASWEAAQRLSRAYRSWPNQCHGASYAKKLICFSSAQ